MQIPFFQTIVSRRSSIIRLFYETFNRDRTRNAIVVRSRDQSHTDIPTSLKFQPGLSALNGPKEKGQAATSISVFSSNRNAGRSNSDQSAGLMKSNPNLLKYGEKSSSGMSTSFADNLDSRNSNSRSGLPAFVTARRSGQSMPQSQVSVIVNIFQYSFCLLEYMNYVCILITHLKT